MRIAKWTVDEDLRRRSDEWKISKLSLLFIVFLLKFKKKICRPLIAFRLSDQHGFFQSKHKITFGRVIVSYVFDCITYNFLIVNNSFARDFST